MTSSLLRFLSLAVLLSLTGCPTPSVVVDDDDDATTDDDDATTDDDDATTDDDDATADDDDATADDDDATADDDDSGDDDDDSGDDDDATGTWAAGDLIITEVMLNVTGNDDDKEWFELFNNSGLDIDLQGFTFSDSGSDSFTVATSVVVADGAFVVLGQSSDTAANGDLAVDYAYGLSGMTLGNSDDELFIEAPDGTPVDDIVWDNGTTFPDPNGETMNLDPLFFDALSNDDGANWCESTAPAYGTNGDLGTPGAANVSCTPVGDDDDSAMGDDDDSAMGDDDDSATGDDDDSAAGDDDDSAMGDDDDDSAHGDDDDSATGDDDDSATGDDDDSAAGDDDDSATGDDDDSAAGDDDDSASSGCDLDPWVNELHYDNSGGDLNEGIEIAGPAGLDLAGWAIEFYNGSNGTVYSPTPLTGILPNTANGIGAIWFPVSGVQNGAPDGFALIDPLGIPLRFLSYEGSFTATSGAATGFTSTDIGVFETGGTLDSESLQLGGAGCGVADFTWQAPQLNTHNAENTGQTFL